MLVIISGPSGVGKGTVIKKLLQKMPSLDLSISYTTRKPRKHEIHGKDYFFVTEKEFDNMDFLEQAEVHGNKYGTPNVKYKKDIIFEVDLQGAKSIKQKREDSLSIFLLPPSSKELENRLIGRKTESKSEIKERLNTAKKELKKRFEHDYLIINKDINNTVKKIKHIINLENEKRSKIHE